MLKIEVVSRTGKVLYLVYRDIQTGTKGKLKNKKFVMFRNKRYVVEGDRFGLLSIYPWGFRK